MDAKDKAQHREEASPEPTPTPQARSEALRSAEEEHRALVEEAAEREFERWKNVLDRLGRS